MLVMDFRIIESAVDIYAFYAYNMEEHNIENKRFSEITITKWMDISKAWFKA